MKAGKQAKKESMVLREVSTGTEKNHDPGIDDSGIDLYYADRSGSYELF